MCVYVHTDWFSFFLVCPFARFCARIHVFFVVRAYMFFFSAVFYKSGLYGRVQRGGSRGKNTSDFPPTQESQTDTQMHGRNKPRQPGWNETLLAVSDFLDLGIVDRNQGWFRIKYGVIVVWYCSTGSASRASLSGKIQILFFFLFHIFSFFNVF